MFNIDISGHTPIYKQLMTEIERLIDSGELKEGDCLPSMNELSAELNISKETVKKVYSILRERGLVESMHGKGFFVTSWRESRKLQIFMLFDKLSQYKQTLYDAFIQGIGHAKLCMILAMLDGVVLRIGLSWFFGIALDMGFYGFVLGYGLAPYGYAIPSMLYFFFGGWQKRRSLSEQM